MDEPMSEDDYPDDEIKSFKPFELEGDLISQNYIRREEDNFFKPLNTQIESVNNEKKQ